MPPAEVETIVQAGLLHDIGKIGVPEAVLRKRAPLAEDEWALMRQHPVIGAQIVAPFEFFAGGALVIRHHHERWDGTGYPDGLAGGSIPLEARIVCACDAWSAMTTDRSYRKARPDSEAAAELRRCAGTHFDPVVVETLCAVLDV